MHTQRTVIKTSSSLTVAQNSSTDFPGPLNFSTISLQTWETQEKHAKH